MAQQNLNTILSTLINNQSNIAVKLVSGNYKSNGNISATNFIITDNNLSYDLKNFYTTYATISGLPITGATYADQTLELTNINGDTISLIIDENLFKTLSGQFELTANLDNDILALGYIKNQTDPIFTSVSTNFILSSEYSLVSGLPITGATYADQTLKLTNINGNIISLTIDENLFKTLSGQFELSANLDSDVSTLGYIKEHQSLSGYYTKSQIDDKGYISIQTDPIYTAASSNIIFKENNISLLNNDAGYLTSHQSLSGYLPLSGGTITDNLTVISGISTSGSINTLSGFYINNEKYEDVIDKQFKELKEQVDELLTKI